MNSKLAMLVCEFRIYKLKKKKKRRKTNLIVTGTQERIQSAS
jgi:hypothetical protein